MVTARVAPRGEVAGGDGHAAVVAAFVEFGFGDGGGYSAWDSARDIGDGGADGPFGGDAGAAVAGFAHHAELGLEAEKIVGDGAALFGHLGYHALGRLIASITIATVPGGTTVDTDAVVDMTRFMTTMR